MAGVKFGALGDEALAPFDHGVVVGRGRRARSARLRRAPRDVRRALGTPRTRTRPDRGRPHDDPAARARGRVGGRRPRFPPVQAVLVQRLYGEREKTAQQLADMSGAPRSTVYGHSTTRRPCPGSRSTLLAYGVTGGSAYRRNRFRRQMPTAGRCGSAANAGRSLVRPQQCAACVRYEEAACRGHALGEELPEVRRMHGVGVLVSVPEVDRDRDR